MWADEMVPIVRQLINDVQGTQYSDDQIDTTIVVAAQLLKKDVSFDVEYAVSIASGTISPDPTAVPAGQLPNGATRDDAFIKLTSLRAGMVLLNQQVLNYAIAAVRLVDGPSTIDSTAIVRGIQQAFSTLATEYNEARLQYLAGARTGFGLTSHRISWR